MPFTRADLMRRLDELGIDTRTHEHEAFFTVEQSRAAKGDIPGGHTKNLFLKDKKDRVFLVVAEADAAIDLKRIHEKIGANGRVTFGKPELLQDLLGVVPGSVTPFGLINDTDHKVTVVLDAPMLEHAVLNYHPLENTATTSIRREDLIAFIRATGHEPQVIAVSHGKLDLDAPPAGD
ncbi:prolyl-tRNA synthetase associated domain-containing protein [Prosthecomicrobium sp. N25]|uniref:prolyl-tRNA synthetase associated domain-containing protein n=1 Tax=Prosthecomicrobium sp. N25 TaxID=3129254 RepID=UPI0030771779